MRDLSMESDNYHGRENIGPLDLITLTSLTIYPFTFCTSLTLNYKFALIFFQSDRI